MDRHSHESDRPSHEPGGHSHEPGGHSDWAPSGLFGDRFGPPAPTLVVRAPGRVNLIGEHIDYSLLPVLPMAIQLRTTLTVRPREDHFVRLTNADRSYADIVLEISADVRPGGLDDAGGPGDPAGSDDLDGPGDPGGRRSDWGDYVRGVVQELVRDYGITVGADISVESDLPIAAGLSSSSALSCGVALALLAVNGRDVGRVELAELVARAERYTGTRGGGMDQAVILCARRGHALAVSFGPLLTHAVEVPADWVFLVAHSGVAAEKSGPAQATYNARTHECREALETVWVALGEGRRPDGDYRPLLKAADPEYLLDVAREALEAPLLARFTHTVSEALRVYEAEAALGMRDLAAFGRIMDTSHQSLRDDYEVSTPELDRIISLAQEGGAAGARLTGAGLGGAVLILCTEAAELAVREALSVGYYGLRGDTPVNEAVFRVAPSGGATVERVGA